jgi:hypothetical protein
MDPERLARLKHEASLMRVSMIPQSVLTVSQLIGEIILDRDWHRDRVQVTDEDVRQIDPEQALAWVKEQHQLRYVVPVGIYAETKDERRLILSAQDEYHRERWRGVTGRRFVIFDAKAINALAAAVGRSPLDVLDEIAATEVER